MNIQYSKNYLVISLFCLDQHKMAYRQPRTNYYCGEVRRLNVDFTVYRYVSGLCSCAVLTLES